jgi:hypothetical protein
MTHAPVFTGRKRLARAFARATLGIGWLSVVSQAASVDRIPQRFQQEISHRFPQAQDGSQAGVHLVELDPEGRPRVFGPGGWWELNNGRWQSIPGLKPVSPAEFVVPDAAGKPIRISVEGAQVRQILRRDDRIWLVTPGGIIIVARGRYDSLSAPMPGFIHQGALAADGTLWIAHSQGLFRWAGDGWTPENLRTDSGWSWTDKEVLGVALDGQGRLWCVCREGALRRDVEGWRLYQGKDGLPWNDFTGVFGGPGDTVWFGTRLGAIRFDGQEWHYRQGPRWLPHDDVQQIVVDPRGNAWLATAGGVGHIEFKSMTLAEKAARYEDEIARYIKRTPYGYVAEAALRIPGDKTTAQAGDSDNDGLWTAMYGAGECFAYAVLRDPLAAQRANQAFEALRFLQKVTQGGSPEPPKGFVARTIRPADWPDPNAGRLAHDREAQKRDRLWKVYEPRWPKSADGRWYWKSDTSSDELDGHFFFYPVYFDFCAGTEAEKERVREVVRDLTDHLLAHRYVLMDHDGRPTRWAMYAPEVLNRDPHWWPERGLNSLSILSYLAAATHVTGDPKYEAASRELIERHGYAQNAMYPKVQQGPGSGNQSDDEMAFMCYYTLLRCSRNEALKEQIRYSFFRYWANEAPEMNPFFNFAYAAHNLEASADNPFGRFPIAPWNGWLGDARETLYGFPLDRINWPHRNSHRLDIQLLGLQQSTDLHEARHGGRGARFNGQVLPVENRHFNHWNTDPWQLDYGGQGAELAAGTVFLLPYYLGLYHGFIERP